jgi:hypothetical protein
MDISDDRTIIAATRHWLEVAVIGLNLCPFAKAVLQKEQIRFVVSHASEPEALARELAVELQRLADSDPEQLETTLLVHPQVLQDFDAYNDFLDVADAVLESLELDGELQVASFHPDYRFEGEDADDVSHCSNRSPYPTLHLLREESIDRAVAAFPDAATVYEKNIETLRRLGWEGWRALFAPR